MAETNLLSYTGNAGLGAGGSDVAVLPNKTDLDVVNKAGENIMLLSAQRNANLFQQKVKDRDTLLELLSKGQVSAGEILPEDRRYFDEAEKKTQDAFFKITNLNDTRNIEAYQKAVTELKDVATHAQHRKISDVYNRKDITDETNQYVRTKKEEEYTVQRKKKFWESIDPLQAVFQFDHNYTNKLSEGVMVSGSPNAPIDSAIKQTGATTVGGAIGLGKPTTGQAVTTSNKTTTKTQEGKPVITTSVQSNTPVKQITGVKDISGQFVKGEDGKTYEVSTQRVSFDRLLDNANSMVYNPEEQDFYQNKEHTELLQNGMPPVQSVPILNTYVKSVGRYLTDTGDVNNSTLKDLIGVVNLDKGQQIPEGKKPIAIVQNGRLQLAISGAELAAIDALSKMPVFTSSTRKWREDIDKFDLETKKQVDDNALGKGRLSLDWYKAMKIDKPKADAEIRKWDAETNAKEETKTGALNFAKTIYEQLSALSPIDNIIAGSKIRKLTTEQLNYLGKYSQDNGVNIKKGLNPLTLGDNDIIELDNGAIRVFRDAKIDPKTLRYVGKLDNTANTTLMNIATNRVNEENAMAGGKEVNSYIPIDIYGSKEPAAVTSSKVTNTSRSSNKMVTMVLPDGRMGQIPESNINNFLKENPKAKKR